MTYLLNANALRLPLADGSVHCVVTSPPYWGLRSYATGDNKALELGSEPTPAAYVANTLAWAREVWRVLRDDGTLWLNLGDSYAANRGRGDSGMGLKQASNQGSLLGKLTVPQGLKEKDLCGIPWRVAFALQDDGWYLRSDIIWHKPNPMPESVTDRPTKAHEYLFLLTKQKKYYYDAEAIKESSGGDRGSTFTKGKTANAHPRPNGTGPRANDPTRNKRSVWDIPEDEYMQFLAWKAAQPEEKKDVWTVTTKPYKGSHFATFPPDLIEPCIKAGTSEKGVCPACGNPWVRVVERKAMVIDRSYNHPEELRTRTSGTMVSAPESKTIGWQPTCTHDHEPTKAIVFDSFAGSGTTLMVARQLGRVGVGTDISQTYLQECAVPRLELDKEQAWLHGKARTETKVSDLPMFS